MSILKVRIIFFMEKFLFERMRKVADENEKKISVQALPKCVDEVVCTSCGKMEAGREVMK